MRRTVTIEQVESTLERWIQAANRGETVVITRGGRPVAALVSAHGVEPDEPTAAIGPDPELVSLLAWEDSEEMLRFLSEG